MPRLSRSLTVLLLVLLLLPMALQAKPRSDAEPRAIVSSALGVGDVLARVWAFLTSLQGDNGCRLEPSGLCGPGPSAPATVDNGCLIEPDGRCRPGQSAAITADNGCWIEPNGRCRD
jgi:hypothetical protein